MEMYMRPTWIGWLLMLFSVNCSDFSHMELLINRAYKEPLNQGLKGKAVIKGYEDFLKPIFSGDLYRKVLKRKSETARL